MLVALLKQAEKKLIAAMVVAHLPLETLHALLLVA